MSARQASEQAMLGQRPVGMGDVFDPFAATVYPGSLRKPPPGLNERGELSAGMGYSSEQDFIQRYGGPPVAEVPFSVWQLNSYLLGTVNAIRVDEPFRRNRRIVVITNTSAVNDVWLGPDSTTRVNFGDRIPPLGARSYPFTELVALYAISNAAGTVVTVSQLAT